MMEVDHCKQKKKSSRDKQPKGILKNANPNATYHKHHHRRKLDELVENERPEIIPTHTHHGRHRHHHEHKHHKSSHSEDVYNERNKEKSRRHKHKHHKHHKNEDSIYDSPKVPPIPVATAMHDKPVNQSAALVEEAIVEQIQEQEVVYDVPRSNPRKVEEAIYVNEPAKDQKEESDYDVPRPPPPPNQLEELIPVDYDVPKIRDSLSTIEEEHLQEYDVPKNLKNLEESDHDPINSQENLYENQAYIQETNKKDDPIIYANDGVTEISHMTDDSRSSGYRSSSSPSIHSEELYVNESVIGSMEEPEETFLPPPPPPPAQSKEIGNYNITNAGAKEESQFQSKEIGVGTSQSLPKSDKKKAKKEKKEKEAKRDRERAQAEAIDKEILSQKAKPSKPKPPKTYFTDNSKIELPVSSVSTSERKQTFLQSIENKPTPQKDRCLDVYHETVRQRVSRNTEAVTEVFDEKKSNEFSSSVKELRSKFEADEQQPTLIKATLMKKIDFKKGFNVMSSLTRRSAMSVSKSMQNLSTPKEEMPKEDEEIEETNETKIEDPLYANLAETKVPEMNLQTAMRNGAESSQANKLLQSAIAEMEDNEKESHTGLGPWNPQKTVAHLYKLQDLKQISQEKQGAEEMEGYLERLPPGKKKSTIWNSWKRQYFVAKAGLLLIFGDSSRSVLMDRIELHGGRVDYMETTMLGIQDRRGHYVVLRFKDGEEADHWHSGLSTHVSHDLAQTFVTPTIVKDPQLFKQILVVDFGGCSVRAGIACSMPTLPQLFFPSVMAIGKNHEDEKYFGMDAFAPEVRSRCNLVHPFAPSSNIDKYTINQIALQGFLEKIFKDLTIDPADYEIQLVSPRPLNDRTQKQLASLLFDEFGVRAVNMAHQSILAMYAYNAHSGIVVDLGERMDVIPIVDGYRVSAGVSRSPVGGPQMRHKLQQYLLGKNYSLTSFVDSLVVRTAIESLSYMSRNFDRELERYHKKPEKIDCILELSKSTKVEMGSERFEAVEGLFKPELWGLDQAGVHVLVHKAIRECSMDVRKEITQSIFLSGGLSQIPGLRERLELELEKLSPATKPRVHGSPYRYHASYIGATVHANSTAFKQTKLTRDEWIGASHRLPHPWNLA